MRLARFGPALLFISPADIGRAESACLRECPGQELFLPGWPHHDFDEVALLEDALENGLDVL